MVLVSAVMTSFNHDKYISESIESVLNQTFPDLELIITDDCSTDQSQKIISGYQNRDPRIKALFHQQNMGITQTINDCLDHVQGKYVCFLDSDDIWTADKLEKQLAILKQDDTKLVWADGDIIDRDGQKTGQIFSKILSTPTVKSGDLFEKLLGEQFVSLQTLIFRSEYIKNLRFDPNLKYVNDHRFLVDLAVDHRFLFMPEHLAKYRIHGGNITFQKELEWAKDKIRIRKYFLNQYGYRLSPKAKADIIYQIGFYLSRLGEKTEAKKYYLLALKIDHAHINSALYTALALTQGDGLAGQLLLDSYSLTTGLLVMLKTGSFLKK